jgi:hypothetical protein
MMKFSELTGKQKAVYSVSALALFAVLGPVLGAAAFAAKSMFMFGVWALAIAAGFAFWGPINRFFKTTALKLAKANARMNPIETLEMDLMKKKESFQSFIKFITDMAAGYTVVKDEYGDLKRDYADRDLSKEEEAVTKMGQAVQVLRDKAKEAGDKLKEYEHEIGFMKRNHAFAKRVGKAMAQLRNVEGVDALDELLKDEAIGQVRQDVAYALAELDQLLDQEGTREVLQIAHNRSPETTDSVAFEMPHFFDEPKKVKA